jgi:epoxyqueuosine reductase
LIVSAPSPGLKEELIEFASEVGFDRCRIARCDSPDHGDAFEEWLQAGAAGEMAYMARGAEKRVDPQKILPGACTVISLALNYWQGTAPEARKLPVTRVKERPGFPIPNSNIQRSSKLQTPTLEGFATDASNAEPGRAACGRIARYAWGDDYHDVIEEKLTQIDRFLQTRGGTQKCYVDTGPVLERDFAARAGLGWHGKSTMLIDKELGTWFFLAEILTTLGLAPDSPQPDRCGTCERCMAACPTGAITSAHRLDARRCISYLTIELKSSIPLEFRSLIGDRIFGCDDCLSACPWNRFAQESREASFAARPATVGMALRDYLGLSDEQFRLLFKKSPIKRIKRRGFLRNVCVALGNVGDHDDLRALQNAASDPDELISEHAQWAIDQIRARESAEGSNFSESDTSPASI